MADRYLIETSATNGYLLEDGTGVLLVEVIDKSVVFLKLQVFAPTRTQKMLRRRRYRGV